MPFSTVASTRKLEFRTLVEIANVPSVLARVAVSISTSAGELTRVGAAGVLKFGGPEVRPTSEFLSEKIWYTSTSTSLIFAKGVPDGISPKILAPVMTVVSCSGKSSAASVSAFPGLGRRDTAPSWFVGLPVSKTNESAHEGIAMHAVKAKAATIALTCDITGLLVVLIRLNVFIV